MSNLKIASHNPGRKLFSSKIATVVVWVTTVIWTIPTLGLFVTSFKADKEILNEPWWVSLFNPNFTLSSYKGVFFGDSSESLSNGVLPYFINSIVITLPATVFPIVIATMAAYALAWIRFRGSDFIFFFIFALQIVPLQMALIPLLLLFTGGAHIGSVTIFPALGIAGDFAGIWLPHTMFALPLAIYLLHNFIASLPRDLMEAAHVDGANHFKVFRMIVLPLSIPGIAAIAIFQFMWVWNDLLVALTFASGTEEVAPINSKLASLVGQYGSGYTQLSAGAFITIAVPLIVFFSLQRYFVRGLLAGSVK
ncbi:MAG: carbohydrate ABC transporter permease [Actinobacteria bacterium]|jgi:alpha-glucoside transport system permease protein|nr:carbohydrate ABC transporter permease [Actinomycetota bacterium]NCV82889.1 carbohydrate ABC transporter permease [Actinomycetota bacterium]NCX37654.1 carbohydrate ABC transporter permease [Actinomycetota bacterium]NCX39365.1 carbohydrate ABC transporter permease [Actinomycetota bacterium]NCX52925.1 carbohydrate ABC transporter permease [Actinomycetota bacterium]